MPYNVFIAHNSHDLFQVSILERLHKSFNINDSDIKIIDVDENAEKYPELLVSIHNNIKNCNLFISILTPHDGHIRPNVLMEFNTAHYYHQPKAIIVFIQDSSCHRDCYRKICIENSLLPISHYETYSVDSEKKGIEIEDYSKIF